MKLSKCILLISCFLCLFESSLQVGSKKVGAKRRSRKKDGRQALSFKKSAERAVEAEKSEEAATEKPVAEVPKRRNLMKLKLPKPNSGLLLRSKSTKPIQKDEESSGTDSSHTVVDKSEEAATKKPVAEVSKRRKFLKLKLLKPNSGRLLRSKSTKPIQKGEERSTTDNSLTSSSINDHVGETTSSSLLVWFLIFCVGVAVIINGYLAFRLFKLYEDPNGALE